MSIELKYRNTRGPNRYVSTFGKKVMSQLKGSYNYEKLYGKKFITEMNATYKKAQNATTLEDKIECHNKLLLFLDSVPKTFKFYYPKKLLKTFKVTIDRLNYDSTPNSRPLTIFDTTDKKNGREGVVEKKDKKGNYTIYYTQYKLEGNDWTSQLTPKKTKNYAYIELEWESYDIIVKAFAKLKRALQPEYLKTIESPHWGGKTGTFKDLRGKTFGNYYYKIVKDARKKKERPEATLLKSLISKYKLKYNYKDNKGKEKKFGITVNYGNSVRRFKF